LTYASRDDNVHISQYRKEGTVEEKQQLWIVREKKDFVAKLEPRFCGCFCGVHFTPGGG